MRESPLGDALEGSCIPVGAIAAEEARSAEFDAGLRRRLFDDCGCGATLAARHSSSLLVRNQLMKTNATPVTARVKVAVAHRSQSIIQ